MRQFLHGEDSAFRTLEEQARRACVRFRRQEMPTNCIPAEADVGFEIDQESGVARLLVANNVRYRGTNRAVAEWLRAGEMTFQSFSDLTGWIRTTLIEAYFDDPATDRPTLPNPLNDGAAQLTDVAAVHEAVREIHRPLYLEEQQIHDGLRKRVLGQDGALEALAAVLVRHCARVHPTRPAVLFAVGPSGVGKTRTAELTARVFHDLDRENGGYQFLRLDMSEYQEEHRISQLIGAPQGYVGHGEGSQLVDALRANPRTIVLFDEIEKAHVAILRVLMNAMDAGRLSAAAGPSGGRDIDCRHAIFMFTSNLNANEILGELEVRGALGDRGVEDEVCRRRLHAAGIAPEIVGRIGRFLVFRSLSPETRAEIVALAIVEVAAEYGLRVSYVQPNVIVDLMQRARSQDFGVRPERYLIDDALGSEFARAVREGMPQPVEVTGPPWECRPQPSDGEATHTDRDDGDRSNSERR